MKFRIASPHYSGITPQREQEWQLALLGLNGDGDGTPPTVVLYKRDDGGAEFGFQDGEGVESSRVVLPHAALRSHFRDYHHIITRLATAGAGAFGMRDYESLDYAKKLVHDEAGDVILAAFAEGAAATPIAHSVARKLFTLIFLVSSDLSGALIRQHRRHGP